MIQVYISGVSYVAKYIYCCSIRLRLWIRFSKIVQVLDIWSPGTSSYWNYSVNSLPIGRRIAFSVTISDGHVNTVADQIIKFDRAFVNEGNSYDPSSGTFTCPENGLYHFSWDVLKVGIGAGLDVDFYVNHRRTFVTWVPGTETYESRTGTLILNLSMGDTVYLKTRQDGRQLHGSIGGAGYCTFNGLKL